jgi:predicted esterase
MQDMSSKFFLSWILILSIFESCGQSNDSTSITQKVDTAQKKDTIVQHAIQKDTILKLNYNQLPVPVTIKYAAKSKGIILVLPGWNFPDTQWCEKTDLCIKGFKQGFDLIFVEMQKSVYLKSYLKQTRKDYSKYPTRTWLIDSAFLPLFKNKLLDSTKPVFVMGLSTGGRGSVILALDNPKIFSGAASLSGDFNPLLQKNDALMINSLGTYIQFPELWQGDNNIAMRAAALKVPVYIGHGKADKISPVAQSVNFVDSLKKNNPKLKIKANFPESAGHNYAYWNSEVDSVLAFFSSLMK